MNSLNNTLMIVSDIKNSGDVSWWSFLFSFWQSDVNLVCQQDMHCLMNNWDGIGVIVLSIISCIPLTVLTAHEYQTATTNIYKYHHQNVRNFNLETIACRILIFACKDICLQICKDFSALFSSQF